MCRALAELVSSDASASGLCAKYPTTPRNLVEVMRKNVKDPNIFSGAISALVSLTYFVGEAGLEAGEPGNPYDLAELLVPRDEAASSHSIGLPLITIVRGCTNYLNGGHDSEAFDDSNVVNTLQLITNVLDLSGTKGLEWVGVRLLSTENSSSLELRTEVIKSELLPLPALLRIFFSLTLVCPSPVIDCLAKKYTTKHGSAAARAKAAEDGSGESEEEGEEEGEDEEVSNWPLEVDCRSYKRDIAEAALPLLHNMTTGLDTDLNPKRILLPPEFVSRTWAILKDGYEGVFDFQLTLAVDACMWFSEGQEVDDYTIAAADAITTALASLLHYTRTGVLLQLEGDMAAYMKEDLSGTLSSRIKYGIIDDKDLGAAMPEAVKHAKALVKLLDSGAVGGMVLREEPKSSGGCCTIS